jgi:hypothetical protein
VGIPKSLESDGDASIELTDLESSPFGRKNQFRSPPSGLASCSCFSASGRACILSLLPSLPLVLKRQVLLAFGRHALARIGSLRPGLEGNSCASRLGSTPAFGSIRGVSVKDALR